MTKKTINELKQGEPPVHPGSNTSPENGVTSGALHKHPSHCVPKNTFCPNLSLERSKVLASMVWWWKYKYIWYEGHKLFYYPLNKACSFHSSSRTRTKRYKSNISRDIKYLVSNGWIYQKGPIDLGDGIIKKWYGIGAKTMLRLARITRCQEHIVNIGGKVILDNPMITQQQPYDNQEVEVEVEVDDIVKVSTQSQNLPVPTWSSRIISYFEGALEKAGGRADQGTRATLVGAFKLMQGKGYAKPKSVTGKDVLQSDVDKYYKAIDAYFSHNQSPYSAKLFYYQIKEGILEQLIDTPVVEKMTYEKYPTWLDGLISDEFLKKVPYENLQRITNTLTCINYTTDAQRFHALKVMGALIPGATFKGEQAC